MTTKYSDILTRLEGMNEQELRRLLAFELTEKPLGLVWERDAIEHDRALNANAVLPRVSEDHSHLEPGESTGNLIIEGDNFDALRLLRKTHAGKIRVIYIDPPYNTGTKDWVYNDDYVSPKDRYRQSKWLEFLYQRMELARDLLTPDGVILVSINDENRANLELLMDKVMPGRRLGSMVWRTRQGSNANQSCFMSPDHEHILVYGNPGFQFRGYEKSFDMYSNPDNDPRGPWQSADLTLGFSYRERPNLYYPLFDPETGIYYPPNPDRIWVYASESKLKQGQRLQAQSMDEFIRRGQVLFPGKEDQRVVVWNSIEEVLAAIDSGDVPKSGKTYTLRRELPDLEQWVGKPVGFGRPRFKRYQRDLKNPYQPVSSWIVPKFEDGQYEAPGSFVSTTNVEGARNITSIFGDKVFNYAKPVTLIRHLLDQATTANDTVLDFFAGSGTTGQAVMELNKQDGGNRRFILCSSTEATKKEPNKNLCRDICAERIRRLMEGTTNHESVGGSFAYLTLELLEEADLDLDATPEHAQALLAMRDTGQIQLPSQGDILTVGGNDQTTILVCRKVNAAVVEELVNWPAKRLIVYSGRPETLSDELPPDTAIECRALSDVYAYTKPSYRPAEVC